MINDVTPPNWQRPKPKRIEPLEKPAAPPLHEQARTVDPTFKTPEEVANDEQHRAKDKAPAVFHHDKATHAQITQHVRSKFDRWLPKTKLQKVLCGVAAVLVAFGIGAGWTLTHHKRTVVADRPKPVTKPAPTAQPIYSNLSGLPITDPALNAKPVTAVMIENSLDARPQSGLADASVVFEAVAEGGVTRFMALYQDTAPDNVGPIRSARPYYVSWAMGFDAAYAHVGGSDAALQDIKDWGVKDMNQFYNGGSYHRVSSRAAPHNVYTAIGTLNQLETSKSYTSTFTSFPRKADNPYATPTKPSDGSKPLTNEPIRIPATSIGFSLSGPTYDPHFDYNTQTNTYDRSEAGDPQVDANGDRRVSPKVVIAMVVPLARGALDSSGAYYSDYNTIGSGTAFVFQDGTMTKGQWSKAANNAPLTFTDANGQPLALNRGQTWISAVSGTNAVSYK